MPRCHKCHGAGFTLHQVAWSMDRVSILCKICDGIGYTYKKAMTPEQSKQAAAIMQKHGEEGWRIESPCRPEGWHECPSPSWNWAGQPFRAVRIERVPTRTPLPIEHYKRGMEVQGKHAEGLVLGAVDKHVFISRIDGADLNWAGVLSVPEIQKWRWPNETEWHPAFTETVEERVVQTLIVEGL